jgi:alkaline phosphatase
MNATCSPAVATLPPCEDAGTIAALALDRPTASIVAVGDIADCSGGRQSEVAALVDGIRPDSVFALGDLAYPNGTLDDFLGCYGPSFGRFRSITHPVVGNHEYHTPHAGAYYAYFCGAAGTTFQGWYSFDVARWHVVALNSTCGGDLDVDPNVTADFGGCLDTSPQVAWLRADLARHPHQCKLAMWHHPRWSSSSEGSTHEVDSFWRVLVEFGVDVVLNGHAHDYQRFPPMNAKGEPDAAGPRAFVVGTGGSSLSSFDDDAPVRSEVRDNSSHGVLKLDLRDGGYAWSFVALAGDSLKDGGEGSCHL